MFWRNSRQSFATCSTAECELLAAMEGNIALQSVGTRIREIMQNVDQKDFLFVDNTAAVTLADAQGGSWRTRHLRVRAVVMRERIQSNMLEVRRIHGVVQLADLSTKSHPAARLKELCQRWNVVPITHVNKSGQVHVRSITCPTVTQHVETVNALRNAFPGISPVSEVIPYRDEPLPKSYVQKLQDHFGMSLKDATVSLVFMVGLATVLLKASGLAKRWWSYGLWLLTRAMLFGSIPDE